MKIILSMAISANGFIAAKDGSEAFLPDENWQYFVDTVKKAGCFIYGRKSYEAVAKWGENYLNKLKKVQGIVVSKSNVNLRNGFSLTHSPEEAIRNLKIEGFKEVILAGGSTLNGEFVQRNLIDEVILFVNPSILGEGIPLFTPTSFQLNLELVGLQKLKNGIVKIRYLVKK